ncbi:hypothetical protein EGR_03316 [Echinococcus granulosus]|uniref:Uncharacterized protein n=1 Tax=Echinococcus granulosus TaxID=6210 RepID=W6UJQ6_ECHGR|nr:hypothetical protein EGR_03316 [Echinococcus granulosus]EUB61770.1 hypothetical protein EGR_03316 [Echinococcus granulosus]
MAINKVPQLAEPQAPLRVNKSVLDLHVVYKEDKTADSYKSAASISYLAIACLLAFITFAPAS